MSNDINELQQNGHVILRNAIPTAAILELKRLLQFDRVSALELMLYHLDNSDFANDIGGMVNFGDYATRAGERVKGFGCHQDSHIRPYKTLESFDYAIRFGAYLEDYSSNSGCIGFLSGSHRTGVMNGHVNMAKSKPGDIVAWFTSTGHTPNAPFKGAFVPSGKYKTKFANQIYRNSDLISFRNPFHQTRNVLFITLGLRSNLNWTKYLKNLLHREYYWSSEKYNDRVLDFNGKNITSLNYKAFKRPAKTYKDHKNFNEEFYAEAHKEFNDI